MGSKSSGIITENNRPFLNNRLVAISCYISYKVAIKVGITGPNTIEPLVHQLLVVALRVGHGCYTESKTIERLLAVAISMTRGCLSSWYNRFKHNRTVADSC